MSLARMPIRTAWPTSVFLVALLYHASVGFHFLLIGGMARQWSNEIAAVSHSLVLHHAFAGVYQGYSGPTAWVAPVYPFLVAAVFWLCGIDTQASAAVLLLLNVIFSSLTTVVIYKLGSRHFSEKVGRVAAWAWALSPLTAMMPLLLWDTSLSALMFCLSLLVLLRSNSLRQWAVTGALWGVCALVSPTLLAPLPAVLVSKLWTASTRLKFGIAFGLTLVCVMLPWSIRNRLELHATFPVRSNAWAEIYFGNVTFAPHPCGGDRNGLYQQLGETRFVQQLRGEAIQYIGSHLGQFVWKTLNRGVRFWLVPLNFLPLTAVLALGCLVGGVFLVQNLGLAAVPFLAVPIFYPIMYAMTHIEARYRHPMEPIVYLMAAYCFCDVIQRCRAAIRKTERRLSAQEP